MESAVLHQDSESHEGVGPSATADTKENESIENKDLGTHEVVGAHANRKKNKNIEKKDSESHEGVGPSATADTKENTHEVVGAHADRKKNKNIEKKITRTHKSIGPSTDRKKNKNIVKKVRFNVGPPQVNDPFKKKDSGINEGVEPFADTKQNEDIKKKIFFWKVQSDEGKVIGGDERSKGDQKLLAETETLLQFKNMKIGKYENRDAFSAAVGQAARKKLPIRSSRARGNKETPIIVSSPSPSEGGSMLQLIFEISNSQVHVIEKGEGRLVATRGNIARSRLASGCDIEFVSMRSNIVVRVDDKLLRKIFIDEASTRTMNLFGMWMENKLPLAILAKVAVVDSLWYSMSPNVVENFLTRFFRQFDVSRIQLCFFPIICRKHWSLFTLYVNKNEKVSRLKGKKSYLLYMDSLGLTYSKECLDRLYSALRFLAPYVADSTIQGALFNPERAAAKDC